MSKVYLLDYVAGNTRSLVNAFEKLGASVVWIKRPEDIESADLLVLPGVGHFGHCLQKLSDGGFLAPLRKYIESGKPFMGICVGMQVLFESSAEEPVRQGLGVIKGHLKRFDDATKSVPHIGWNLAQLVKQEENQPGLLYDLNDSSRYYYVHSYAAPYSSEVYEKSSWSVVTSKYGDEQFIGAVAKDNVLATQFHPEKSGAAGLRVLDAFLHNQKWTHRSQQIAQPEGNGLTHRVIACLDVRTNDQGDLVVTKGDQYDVRDKAGAGREVRNLGKPVAMAQKYYSEGADEIVFLNITSFRDCPISDLPMLDILRLTSQEVFVPLTVGGGIRNTKDIDGTEVSALDIATMYFKSGADKVSIGSDAVLMAEDFIEGGGRKTGTTAIEAISSAYGKQAVIISVDPRRIYVASPKDTSHHVIKTDFPGPEGQEYCWYQCTIKGGREGRDIDVRQLVTSVEALGAGEILLNCIDRDGSSRGFDLELINAVKSCIKIPVIASSGAGNPDHFAEVFQKTRADAALGAGMFHRGEYTIDQVKHDLIQQGLAIRESEKNPS